MNALELMAKANQATVLHAELVCPECGRHIEGASITLMELMGELAAHMIGPPSCADPLDTTGTEVGRELAGERGEGL